jgi:hypothetical protein
MIVLKDQKLKEKLIAVDHSGRPINKDDIVYDSDSDDFDTPCYIRDTFAVIDSFGGYKVFLVLFYEESDQGYRGLVESTQISLSYGR